MQGMIIAYKKAVLLLLAIGIFTGIFNNQHMTTINTVLPLHIRASRKYYRRKFIGYFFLLLLFIVAFWFGSGRFFTDDYYYPQMVILMPIAIVGMIYMMIREAIAAARNKPIILMDDQGIQVLSNNFDKLGLIHWEDITGYREVAIDGYRRKMSFYVMNPVTYFTRVQSAARRKKLTKQSGQNNGALFWIESGQIDYDVNAFKRILSEKIKQQS
jgi:hypothetical protein